MSEPNPSVEPGVYQLRVVLRGISPLIWRRLLVRRSLAVKQRPTGGHSLPCFVPLSAAARALVESECLHDEYHCPAQWCTDEVQSEVVEVRTVTATHASAISTAPAPNREEGDRAKVCASG